MAKNLIIRLIIYGGMGALCLLMFQSTVNLKKNPHNGALPPVRMEKNTFSYLDDGQWEDALDELVPMYEEDGSDPNLKYYLALCYKEIGRVAFQEKRYEDAIEMFEVGLGYVDDDVDILMGLGAARFLISDFEGAESAFLSALQLDPENADAHGQLGEIYYLKNEWQMAEASWSLAHEIDPEIRYVERRLGEIRKQLHMSETLDMDENVYFSVSYDGETMPQLEYTVLEILEKAYYDIGATLQAYPKRQIAVTLLTRQEYFDVTGSPEWSSGIYEGHIKVPLAGAETDIARLQKTLYHEYVHAVLFDQMGARCPWWLNEGLAQYLSIENPGITGDTTGVPSSPPDGIGLSDIKGVLDLDKNAAGHAYAMALSAVRHLVSSYGEAGLQKIISLMAEGETFETAIWTATGYTFDQFESDWRRNG